MGFVAPALEEKKNKKNKVTFLYTIEQKEDFVLLSLKGHVLEEFQLEELYNKMNALLDEGVRSFIVDLANISHMNSSGLNLLIRLLTKCRNKSGEMILCNLPSKIENLLIISKLSSIFEIEKDLHTAIGKLNQSTI